MRRQTLILVTALAIVAMLAASGCAGFRAQEKHAGWDDVQGTGQYVSGTDLGDLDRVSWLVYRSTEVKNDGGKDYVQTIGFNSTNTTCDGVAARHMIARIEGPEVSGYLDYYYDLATKKPLKAHLAMNAYGIKLESDIPADMLGDRFKEYNLGDPVFLAGDTQFERVADETVTVPAGTYSAIKYRSPDGKERSQLWVSTQVPVPLKIVSYDDRKITTLELLGWG